MRIFFAFLFALPSLLGIAQSNSPQNFSFDSKAEYVILFIPNDAYGISQELSGEIAKYNAKHHLDLKLTIKQYRIPFLSVQATVYVERFKDYKSAKEYLDLIAKRNPDFYRGKILENSLAISIDNLKILIQNKNKSAYLEFVKTLP